jgi:hypothetical protein
MDPRVAISRAPVVAGLPPLESGRLFVITTENGVIYTGKLSTLQSVAQKAEMMGAVMN